MENEFGSKLLLCPVVSQHSTGVWLSGGGGVVNQVADFEVATMLVLRA